MQKPAELGVCADHGLKGGVDRLSANLGRGRVIAGLPYPDVELDRELLEHPLPAEAVPFDLAVGHVPDPQMLLSRPELVLAGGLDVGDADAGEGGGGLQQCEE